MFTLYLQIMTSSTPHGNIRELPQPPGKHPINGRYGHCSVHKLSFTENKFYVNDTDVSICVVGIYKGLKYCLEGATADIGDVNFIGGERTQKQILLKDFIFSRPEYTMWPAIVYI